MRIHIGDLRPTAWSEIRFEIYKEYGRFEPDRWFNEHYNARDVSIFGRAYSRFEFSNKEKYVEFCLKWM